MTSNTDCFSVFMAGVGGQGIGMLSETLARACDYAGYTIRGCDTHGLAQRGGIVTSHLRLGDAVWSPLVPLHEADLVIALERHEALRGAADFLKPAGTLVWYDTIWQPLHVRLGKAEQVSLEMIDQAAAKVHWHHHCIIEPDLADTRMSNIVLLAFIANKQLIPQLSLEHCKKALSDLLEGASLEKNIALLSR